MTYNVRPTCQEQMRKIEPLADAFGGRVAKLGKPEYVMRLSRRRMRREVTRLSVTKLTIKSSLT
jgi:hypothetical protein